MKPDMRLDVQYIYTYTLVHLYDLQTRVQTQVQVHAGWDAIADHHLPVLGRRLSLAVRTADAARERWYLPKKGAMHVYVCIQK